MSEKTQQHDSLSLCMNEIERNGYYLAKRLLDIIIVLGLLVVFFPIMLLIALAIYIYSPGPVFFVQERVGAVREVQNNSYHWKRVHFNCYKFRTMKLNVDSAVHKAYIQALIQNNEKEMNALQEGSNQSCKHSETNKKVPASQDDPNRPRKLVHDSRIIRPGVFLRKLSLDELPQLWNVLKGDMSLVGPRPAIPYEVDMYKEWHLRRLEAQPGLTGLQQITARCIADFDEQVKLDIEYIERQSLWLDIKIILKTPFAVISTKGAY
jgi:lipopolysaccharide/colanic/teichoic acid biosynthesis glycosyltransferase